MKPEDFFKNGKFYVWKEVFAVVKSKKPLAGAFAVIQDKNETTVIIDQSKFSETAIEMEKGWKILTFEMVLPFGLVGFLAKISKALADENISLFAISAYSTDHILVKEKDLSKAISKLKTLGLSIKQRA
ncbi:MAG: ACT domain-containing protein [Candidatus Aenigmatarchaeota archaeon]